MHVSHVSRIALIFASWTTSVSQGLRGFMSRAKSFYFISPTVWTWGTLWRRWRIRTYCQMITRNAGAVSANKPQLRLFSFSCSLPFKLTFCVSLIAQHIVSLHTKLLLGNERFGARSQCTPDILIHWIRYGDRCWRFDWVTDRSMPSMNWGAIQSSHD